MTKTGGRPCSGGTCMGTRPCYSVAPSRGPVDSAPVTLITTTVMSSLSRITLQHRYTSSTIASLIWSALQIRDIEPREQVSRGVVAVVIARAMSGLGDAVGEHHDDVSRRQAQGPALIGGVANRPEREPVARENSGTRWSRRICGAVRRARRWQRSGCGSRVRAPPGTGR